ncbi:hypothetical protein [Stappia sp. BW2]|uniref:hypothetical protein n=1 Tax=Stappia sp. BW2 TaxID=2592622 RepID=UPI001967B598|nr:hypothetical protein [Stappia sp. BW2]
MRNEGNALTGLRKPNPANDREKIDIAVVFHSGYGHTERQAAAVRNGIEDIDGLPGFGD